MQAPWLLQAWIQQKGAAPRGAAIAAPAREAAGFRAPGPCQSALTLGCKIILAIKKQQEKHKRPTAACRASASLCLLRVQPGLICQPLKGGGCPGSLVTPAGG